MKYVITIFTYRSISSSYSFVRTLNPQKCLFFLSLITLSGCDRLGTIPYSPKTTPEMWLNTHPYVNISIGPLKFVLMEPTSTFFVYLLSFIGIMAGTYFLLIRENHRSRLWWGVALLIWGVQAFLGGTNYQALSYELKCAGREVCSYLSWVEIYYLLISILSINAMAMGVAYSSTEKVIKRGLTAYAIVNTAAYSTLFLTGG